MKFAFFKGCKIPYYLEQYETSTRAVLKPFGVRLVDLEFNCCGYPNRDIHFESFVFSAARNLAIAEKKRLDILTPCKCCYGTLKYAQHFLKENEHLRGDINKELAREGLAWRGKIAVKHILTVLCDDIGLPAIYASIRSPLGNLSIAPHYGCHALRPSDIVHFDDPLAPSIFEDLISATGAKPVEWPRRLDCCGNPLWVKNRGISLSLMRAKITDAAESGADCLCTACTYCQIQFDAIQNAEMSEDSRITPMPSVLYTQLLGLSMGLPERVLGMKRNHIQCDKMPRA
ncbi:MAG: CoB--CoM heterodisulfide reductase iron-sulfur subunit B family protein [Spirochaetes bacterium]|nr:CoB--CoM heterodisulfide reductase iron-sulfur subunit B family protein [Spirochaetota bacterium]